MQPTLTLTTEERYYDMLGAVPPVASTGAGFLVGEAIGDHRCRIEQKTTPDYRAFFHCGERFFEVREPMTVAEFRSFSLDAGMKELDRTIVVIVSGGVVQNIENVPRDVTVEVRDYDNDKADDLPRDDNGDAYEYAIYRAQG